MSASCIRKETSLTLSSLEGCRYSIRCRRWITRPVLHQALTFKLMCAVVYAISFLLIISALGCLLVYVRSENSQNCRVLYFAHRPEFQILEQHNVSEMGSVPVLKRWVSLTQWTNPSYNNSYISTRDKAPATRCNRSMRSTNCGEAYTEWQAAIYTTNLSNKPIH